MSYYQNLYYYPYILFTYNYYNLYLFFIYNYYVENVLNLSLQDSHKIPKYKMCDQYRDKYGLFMII